jgi:hypothetical protein
MKPKFEGIDSVYKSKADNKDIRDLLERLVPKAKAQMVEFSQQFKGRTEQETCKKIFDYLKNNFTYVADGEEQIIKLPSALLAKKVGDCKSYSLFTSAILENLGIPYHFVYASYTTNPIPGHVYVTTDKGCIIDAVYGIFNQEKKPNYKYKKNMNVRYMAGVDCPSCDSNSTNVGVGNINTVLLAPGRGFFSLLIKGNVDGIASRLQNGSITNATKFADKWKQLGGDRTILTKQIKEGASKRPKNLGFFKVLKRILQKRGIKGIGQTQIPEEVKALIRAACVKLGSAVPAVGTAGAAALSETIINLLPVLISAINTTPEGTGDEIDWGTETNTNTGGGSGTNTGGGGGGTTPGGGGGGTTPGGSGMNLKVILPIVAVVAAGGIYLATRKK